MAAIHARHTTMNEPAHGVLPRLPLSCLIADIEASHHVFTRTALERIAALFAADHADRDSASQALRCCFDELRADLLPHLVKEERILFPYISALENNPEQPPDACFGSVSQPIRMMQIEHEQVKTLLAQLRQITTDYAFTADPQINVLYAALADLDGDLQEHIRREDEILFPCVLALARKAS